MACPGGGDLPPTKPTFTLIPTQIYGIPKKVAGRTVAGTPFTIQGIVIHCLELEQAAYDNKLACATPSGVSPTEVHASMHYSVSNMGTIHQYVDDADIAWAFRPYLDNMYATPPGAFCAISWEPLNTDNGGATPDVYVLNVGIEGGVPVTAKGCYNCPTPTTLQQAGYNSFIHLLAYLADQYSIPIDTNHIQFHEFIECEVGEECIECNDIDQIIADVLAYCEPCDDEAPLLPEETCPQNIKDFRARTVQNCCDDNGCEVYVTVDNCFLGSLVEATTEVTGTLPDGILGLENRTGALCPTGDDLCIVSGCIAVTDPITGCGTTPDPLMIDRCLFDTFLPADVIVDVVGLDATGCLVQQPCTDFVPQCETPLTCVDTTNIDLTCSGTSNHTIQAEIIFDPNPNNLAEDVGNGLLVLFECVDLTALFAAGTIANFYGDDGLGNCVTQDAATLIGNTICSFPINAGETPTYILGRDAVDCPEFYTPIEVVAAGLFPADTPCIDITYDTNTGILTIDPIIDPAADNILQCGISGLYVPELNITDSNCIDLTIVANNLTADLIISPDANNILECRANGAYAGFTVNDTNCIDLTFAAGVLTADPIIAPPIAGVNNALICDATGLFVPQGANVAVNGPITGTGTNLDPLDIDFSLLTLADRCDIGANLPLGTLSFVVGLDGSDCLVYNTLAHVIENGLVANDTDCINLTLTGNVLTADPIIPVSVGGITNILSCDPTGLFVPVGAGIVVADTDCIDLTLTTGGTLSADIIIAPTQGGVPNIISCIPGQGLYAALGGGITVADTDCVDLTLAAGQITADIIVSPTAGNALICDPGNGLFVDEIPPIDPDACNGLVDTGSGLFVNGDLFVFDQQLSAPLVILATNPQPLPATQGAGLVPGDPVTVVITNPSSCNEMHCDITIENQQLNIGNISAGAAAQVSMVVEYTLNGGAVWINRASLGAALLMQIGDFSEPNASAIVDSLVVAPGGSFTFGMRRYVWNPDGNFLGFATVDDMYARITCVGLTPP